MKFPIRPNRPPGASDFDFLFGSWTVLHRKLTERLVGSQDWMEFPGTMEAEPIVEGLGNFDRNLIRQPGGTYQASTLRLFHPNEGRWSLQWIDARNAGLEPPLYGSFQGDVGTFYGNDSHLGRPIAVRFFWRQAGADNAMWEQAFSADEGSSWETNWTMEFTRA